MNFSFDFQRIKMRQNETCTGTNRKPIMSTHVLLNLLNKLWKRDKMPGLSNILSLFRNDFIKFNNIRALLFAHIYHMTLMELSKHVSGVKSPRLCHIHTSLLVPLFHNVTKYVNHLWLMDFEFKNSVIYINLTREVL